LLSLFLADLKISRRIEYWLIPPLAGGNLPEVRHLCVDRRDAHRLHLVNVDQELHAVWFVANPLLVWWWGKLHQDNGL
jgi:hypothetical protein